MVFVAVHSGAGFQSESNKHKYLNVCKEACNEAMKQLLTGKTAVEAVTEAICTLEDNQLTNAGFGSNLCNDGTVECDASVMDGESLHWAAVGAVDGVKNPIRVAKLLLDEQCSKNGNKFGLLPPNILVADGAKQWALKRGLEESKSLVSDRAKACFLKYKRKIEHSCSEHNPKNEKVQRLDTVGVVAVDDRGVVAAAVSSGGVILKNPGRVGQAAMYGCGVWAEDNVAVTTTGSGEYLTKTLFAKECAQHLMSNEEILNAEKLKNAFVNKFINSRFLKDVDGDKLAGVLCVVLDKPNNTIELLWAHNSKTLTLAYCSENSDPIGVFSKLPPESGLIVQSIPLPFTTRLNENSNSI